MTHLATFLIGVLFWILVDAVGRKYYGETW